MRELGKNHNKNYKKLIKKLSKNYQKIIRKLLLNCFCLHCNLLDASIAVLFYCCHTFPSRIGINLLEKHRFSKDRNWSPIRKLSNRISADLLNEGF